MLEQELLCLAFPDDREALEVSQMVEKATVAILAPGKPIEHYLEKNAYAMIVASGSRLHSHTVVDMLLAAQTTGTMLGFFSHPTKLSLLLPRAPQIPEAPRHAILNYCDERTISIEEPDFWYASGSAAKGSALLAWQEDGERPTLISLLAHARENHMYTIDSFLCSKYAGRVPMEHQNDRLPACYTTGRCYRSDSTPVDIGRLQADVVVLNGCTTFKLGSDVFAAQSSMVYRLVESGCVNVIGSPMIKAGFREELLFLHAHMGRKTIGEMVRHLNDHHVSCGIKIPAFALWGDPRHRYPILVPELQRTPERIGPIEVGMRVESTPKPTTATLPPIDEQLAALQEAMLTCRRYEQLEFFGFSLHVVAGQFAQIRTLLQGASNLVAEAAFVEGGRAAKQLHDRLRRLQQAMQQLESLMLRHILERTFHGFQLLDAYRTKCTTTHIQEEICPMCQQKSYLVRFASPFLFCRIAQHCPRCGVVADYPGDEHVSLPQVTWHISDEQVQGSIAGAYGWLGASIHSGSKFGFSTSLECGFAEGNPVSFILPIPPSVQPHWYYLKIYSLQAGKLVHVVCPMFIQARSAQDRNASAQLVEAVSTGRMLQGKD
ncbi:MAG TPA: hypothetical protein VKY19_07855 [Ktedonosporobacter sp.]|jgi:hypothetical protein|nr:hypothetical protein [Ktedonosporobacter sp.]